MKTLGDRIRYSLEIRDMKQKELAKLIGLSEVTLSRYVNNEREPRVKSIVAICKSLGISADWLLGMMQEEPHGYRDRFHP